MAAMASSPSHPNGYQNGPPQMMGPGIPTGPPMGMQMGGQMNSSPRPTIITPKSHVGFDSITQQIERKLLKRGFQFNVICVGTSM